MKVVSLSSLIDLLRSAPKYYIQQGLPARTLFYARAGRPLSHETARRILALAREKVCADIVGLQLPDGTTIYTEGVIESLQAEISDLRTHVDQLQRLTYRRVLGGAPLSLSPRRASLN